MTASHGLKSINCTSCGAGLSVLGGGRVLSQVCGYCGAVLDAQDNYKVLDSIGKRNHPSSPVQIGMVFKHEGVDFTVIGTLGIIERYGGQTWRWVEHQIFSPTHGYLWLNIENGNMTFTRKIRDYDMRHWLSPSTVERAETPPVRFYQGQKYRYYDSGVTQIDFMEGEFNWIPKLGEKKKVVNLLGDDAMLGLVKSETEREVEVSKLLDREETAKQMGFDASALGQPERHPLTPYQPIPNEKFVRRTFFWTAFVALIMGFVFAVSSGRTVLDSPTIMLSQLPESYEFEITNTGQLAEVRFETNLQNSWGAFSAEIIGPNGEPLVAGARSVSYFSGRSGGESWSEGSRNASFRFRPQEAGTHSVRFERMNAGTAPDSAQINLRISQGTPTGTWLYVLAVLCGIGWLVVRARSAFHHSRRFAGSDWTSSD